MVRLRLALLVALLLGLTGLPGTGGVPSAAAATPTAGQSTYVPLPPARLLDTRRSSDPLAGRVGAGGTRDLRVTGVAGVPTSATAVVLNVTVVKPTTATDIRVYPTPVDGSIPLVSTLNAPAGRTVANLATVKVGDGGRVRLRNGSGVVHLVADISGYYVGGGSGATYTGTTPRRLLDTRDAAAPLGPGAVRRLVVRGGTGGAPVGATAVVLNVTAVAPTTTTNVRVYPGDLATPPTVSNLNPPAGLNTAAAVIVRVGAEGDIALRNSSGSVHLVVDLSGWYVPGTAGSVFHPVAPRRLLDQRTTGTTLGAGGTADLRVASATVVPPMATAAVLNVTATAVTAASNVRVYPRPRPGSTEFPLASNLNVRRGSTVANAVVATLGRDGGVRMRNEAGSLSLVVDLAGWFGPAGEGWDISWPQCVNESGTSSRTGTRSRHPVGGGFAVIGLVNGTAHNFQRVACFDDAYAWASSLPGDPSVYVILDAPGNDDADWKRVTPNGPRPCNGTNTDVDCGWNYGWHLLDNALTFLPRDPDGSRPMVWLDVEGPYSTGPEWQGPAVNRAVISAAVERVRRAGVRVGIYTDHASSSYNDWRAITGGTSTSPTLRFPTLQTWIFPAPATNPHSFCSASQSPTGGPVVMTQYQTKQADGHVYDTNHPC